MNIQVLIIDPQNDFCWPGCPTASIEEKNTLLKYMPKEAIEPGSLFVPGADQDMVRAAAMISRLKEKIDDIHVTMDSHHWVDIAHPIFLINSKGEHPPYFTIVSEEDILDGVWRATNPNFQSRLKEYVSALKKNGRYPLCIWPPHCRIGTWGHNVFPDLANVLLEWEKEFAMVNYVTKGSNFWTEHYSAVMADVPDPEDPSTLLNDDLIDVIKKADIILLMGEAKSHCLRNTVIDIADNFGEENIKKLYLVEDCTSIVPDPPGTTIFTDAGDQFVKDMVKRGMNVVKSTEFLR